MNTIGVLIATVDPDFILLDKKTQALLMSAVMLYVFRVIESTELSDYFKDNLEWKGQDCIDFRKVLQGKGYIQKNLKFFLYATMCGLKPDPQDFQLKTEDAEFVIAMRKSRSPMTRKLVDFCDSRRRVGHKPRTLTEFDKGMSKVMPELIIYCDKFINKKFKFLTQSGQQHKIELRQELLMSGIYAQYRAYPEIDNLLHLKNIAMTAIHNRGQNIIQEQTSQSRQRLSRNEDGTFVGLLMSINVTDFDMVFSQDAGVGAGGSMITCNALMASLDGTSCEYERPTDVDRQRDLRQAIDTVLDMIPTEKGKQFTSLLMGLYDEGFSKFLKKDNDEASDSMPYIEYSRKVREYLDIPAEKAQRFVQRLRQELKDFKT
jgi:hypothetical protein